MAARWYIIHAYSGFENKVRDSIIAEAERLGLSEGVEEVEVPVDEAAPVVEGGLFAGWTRQVVVTIFLMGACYFSFKFLRYALDSWGPLAIEELFKVEASTAQASAPSGSRSAAGRVMVALPAGHWASTSRRT